MLGKLLNSFNYDNPYEGNMYFVRAGGHSGDFYVSVGKKEDNIIFFNVTKSEDREKVLEVPELSLKSGIENKIVELVERLPYNVYKEIKELYENTHTRL